MTCSSSTERVGAGCKSRAAAKSLMAKINFIHNTKTVINNKPMNHNVRISSNWTGKMCINWYRQCEVPKIFATFLSIAAAKVSENRTEHYKLSGLEISSAK